MSACGTQRTLYVCLDPLVYSNAARINALALAARLPVIHSVRESPLTGGLTSYGPDFPDMSRRAAELVDKILRGAKPADIPVEQPTKFDLVINLKNAKALGLTMPGTVLARAAFSGSRRSRRCAAAVRRLRLGGDRWFWDRRPSLPSKPREKRRSTCRPAGSVAA